MKRRGFTIVELLIVIVVIAILAAITVVAYNGIQQRSRVTALWTSIMQVDKSFRLYLTNKGDTTWPNDVGFAGAASNPTLQQIISATSFGNFMQHPPSQGTNWFYDNDGDTYPAGGMTGGVNICLDSIDSALALATDQAKDDGNINTGALRYNGSRLYYSVSTTQTIN